MLSASSMEVERPQKTVSQNTRVFSKSGDIIKRSGNGTRRRVGGGYKQIACV